MKAVLFDLDDTLLKTREMKWACHKAVAKKFWNIDLSDEALAVHWGKPMSVLISHIYDANDTQENRLDAYLSMTDDFPKGVYDGALAKVCELLDGGLHVGVVTSARESLAKADLLRHEFPIERFCILQGEESHPAHKPDPSVFDPAKETLARHGVAPSDVVYVGDSLYDAGAAVGAGFTFVGVTTGLVSGDELLAAGASRVIDDIRQLAV